MAKPHLSRYRGCLWAAANGPGHKPAAFGTTPQQALLNYHTEQRRLAATRSTP